MAGHSQFKNIMHRKGAQDAKRAKLFTKVLREVTVAAKINADVEHNPRLRNAIQAARIINTPKDRIENAINKASKPLEGGDFDEIRYEGYGPGGVALIVEALTDNRNRTASEVRSAFTKFGGQMGETGSVSFMFKRVGVILYPIDAGSPETFLEATIEGNGSDCLSKDGYHEIICEPELLNEVRQFLEEKFGIAESCSLTWKPTTITMLSDTDGEKLLKMLDAFDNCDDVQNVIGNFELSEKLMKQLAND
ncbi:MAG: YebC/PmpR family DNA-binding transcriptional regulator [Alphaproteobacteria bacterium]|jgi:YebC/PmpR family DNA-binding regulatory protein|nr:YebC/PmpR family DNA-binding transcriptional regulator [Candidatus Jidaibacter sp.]